MTAPDRARLRELLDEGSKRPWRFKLDWPAEGDYYSTWQDSPEDVALIVEAVNALPGLLDALDEAEKERDAAQTAHGELFGTFTETEARLDEAEKALPELQDALVISHAYGDHRRRFESCEKGRCPAAREALARIGAGE